MPVLISQFLSGGEMLLGDQVAGLRAVNGVENDYRFNFPGTGVKDSAGNYMFRWFPGIGVNANYVQVTSSPSTFPAILQAAGSDINVNLELLGQGTGYVYAGGVGMFAVPAGTAVQAPLVGTAGGIRYNTTSQYLDYWSTVSNSWVDLTSGSGLSNLTYITQTDETAFAPNSQPLSLLATGFATVTTATGIVGSRVLTGTTNEISISHGDGTVGNPTFSIPTTFIAPGTIAAVTSVSAPAYLVTGSGSGTISILPQAAAGTFNFNLPITAGTSGYVLTSGGGGASPMTWTNLSSATVTSISGTANEITASASTGAVTLSIPSTFIAPGSIQATTSSAAASFLLNGSGSGVISILPQAAAGTFNFNLPITAGTSGYVLTSAGGGSSPMTWTNLGSAAVTSISGTANEITASASTGAVTLSIPSTFIAPGSIAATTTVSGTTFNSSTLTASTALASDSSKNVVSSSTTATELGYVHGVTSAIQTQFTNKITVTSAEIYSADSGSANAYAVTLSPAPGSYSTGMVVNFVAAHANTTASTINVNTLGNKNITKQGTNALVSGDIAANQMVSCIYDGTQFQLINPTANVSSGTVTSINASVTPTGAGSVSGGPVTTSGTLAFTFKGNLLNVQTFTSGTAATYTPTTGTKTAWIRMWGPGGGGGGAAGASGNLGAGGGGAGGGYVEHLLTSVSGTYTYTIGSGGAGGAAGNNNGAAGSAATTFSGGTLSAGAGPGGGGSAASAPAAGNINIGGVGTTSVATASGGNIANLNGGQGLFGQICSTTLAITGQGGASGYGGAPTPNAATGATLSQAGANASTNSGAGGAGGLTFNQASAAGSAGGNGAAGQIIIFEFS